MPDLNIQLILDKLTTTVIGVTPRVVPSIPFTVHTGNIPLEALQENAIRVFEWRDGDLETQDDGLYSEGQPKADADSTWYGHSLTLAVIYPTAYLVPGDDPVKPRGLTGMRLADTVDLNKVLMFDDPLATAPLTGDYMLLKLVKGSRSGRVRLLEYQLNWQEPFAG